MEELPRKYVDLGTCTHCIIDLDADKARNQWVEKMTTRNQLLLTKVDSLEATILYLRRKLMEKRIYFLADILEEKTNELGVLTSKLAVSEGDPLKWNVRLQISVIDDLLKRLDAEREAFKEAVLKNDKANAAQRQMLEDITKRTQDEYFQFKQKFLKRIRDVYTIAQQAVKQGVTESKTRLQRKLHAEYKITLKNIQREIKSYSKLNEKQRKHIRKLYTTLANRKVEYEQALNEKDREIESLKRQLKQQRNRAASRTSLM